MCAIVLIVDIRDENLTCCAERGLLAVRAHGHGSDFCFVVTHLESPMGKLLKQWLGQQRVEQAMQALCCLCQPEI